MLLPQLLPLLLLLQLAQLSTAATGDSPDPGKDEVEANINPAARGSSGPSDPNHVNGPIRDRWCQEKCMRHCYCTYGLSCRRSCIAYCDRGPYQSASRDPFMHNRSKRAAKPNAEKIDLDEAPPSISQLENGVLPYLDGFAYDSRSILRRKVGRPTWDPRAKDLGAKKERALSTKWGALCQDPGN